MGAWLRVVVVLGLVGCIDVPERGLAPGADAEPEADRPSIDGATADTAPPADRGLPDRAVAGDAVVPDAVVPDAGPPDAADLDAGAPDAAVDPDAEIEPDAAVEPDAEIEPDAEPDASPLPDPEDSVLVFSGCLPQVPGQPVPQHPLPCLEVAIGDSAPSGVFGHTALPLGDGRVMLLGGFIHGAITGRADIYDPITDVMESPPGFQPQRWFAAARTDSGVVTLGGVIDRSELWRAHDRVFSPAEQGWADLVPLSATRAQATAWAIGDDVLVIAGRAERGGGASNTVDRWNSAGAALEPLRLNRARFGHLQVDHAGQPLVVGGASGAEIAIDSAELRNADGGWDLVTHDALARVDAAGAALSTGVFVTGGRTHTRDHPNQDGVAATSDVVRIALGDAGALEVEPWRYTMNRARWGHTVSRIGTGQRYALVVGGAEAGPQTVVELFDAEGNGRWYAFSLPQPGNGFGPAIDVERRFHAAATNGLGWVIVSGGAQPGGPVAAVETYFDQTLVFRIRDFAPEPVE